MPNYPFDIVRRICLPLGLVILILGLATAAASAGVSSGLRNLLQGVLGVDLRVDSLALDKGQATVGETLRATVGISNGGKTAATSTVLTLWARFGSSTSTSNAFRLATHRLGTLNPQTRITSVSTFPVPNFGRVGAYQVFAVVESSAPEQLRQNNTQARTLMVIGPAFSDTDSQPASDAGDNSTQPAPTTPVVGGGSSPPPSGSTGGSGSSTPSATPPPTSSPDSGSSSPPPVVSNPSPSPTPPPPVVSNPSPSPPPPPPPSAACDFYASPTGRGDGSSPNLPFRIQSFWQVAAPGKTLCLLDGIYIGADSMINPPSGLRGTSTAKITIRALHDGQAVIDGQFVRRPVALLSDSGNHWFVFEGFNAKNSSGSVLHFGKNSNGHIVRRVVAWDTLITSNSETCWAAGNNILFEDVACFGTGRKSITNAQGGVNNNFICRRCWARWEGSTKAGPKMAFSMTYNSYGATCENCIAMASGESMPESYGHTGGNGIEVIGTMTNFETDQTYGLFAMDRMDPADKCANLKLLGSLAILRRGDRNIPWLGAVQSTGTVDCYAIKDTFVFIHSGAIGISDGFRLSGDSGTGRIAQNITSVRPSSASDNIQAAWNVSNQSIGTSLGAVADPWIGAGAGANLCKKWGKDEALWPWPMNDRIKAATASAGAYRGPCTNCTGGRLTRTATDVTATVESLLGPIPPNCRR